MRTKTNLNKLDDLRILYEFLYIDENNSIIYNNGLTDLEIKMDENFNLKAKNLSTGIEIFFNQQMDVPNTLEIIDILKETSARNSEFGNKWKEICFNVSVDKNKLDDLIILYKFLYMNENNSVIYNNGFTDLEIKMDENFNLKAKNLNTGIEFFFIQEMDIPSTLEIINILKKMSAQIPKCGSRWEEIRFNVNASKALKPEFFKNI